MKITIKRLREIVSEAGKIGASDAYLKKERIRESLQDMIVNAIQSGDVKDQSDLDSCIATFDMAIKALKMVPFEAYKKMHSEKLAGGDFGP